MSVLAQYSAPFEGLNTSVPDTKIKPSECAALDKVVFYEGLLQGTQLNTFGIISGDDTAIRAIVTFTDPNDVLQNIYITDNNIFQTTTGYTTQQALPAVGQGFVSWVVFSNRVFFVNGSQYVLYWDGTVLTQATNLYGALYIFELGSSICIANTIEAGGNFNQRIRWAVAGTFNEWDPSAFVGAGFEDLLETPDGIHGVLNTNPVAYILRSNGISQMIPTGVGTSAFSFNHLWASQLGIGNVVDFSAATFGPYGFVLSYDDIYIITASSYDRVALKVKNQLYADIANSITVFGWMEPFVAQSQPYLRYRLGINHVAGVTIWSFSTETKAWEKETYTDKIITGPGQLLGSDPNLIWTQIPCVPFQSLVDNNFYFGVYLPPSTNILEPVSYTFKRESDPQDRTITVRQIKVRYQYMHQSPVPMTITVQGMYGSVSSTLNLNDPTKSYEYYGGSPPPVTYGNFYNAYFTVPITDPEIQVSFVMGPGGVPISDIVVFGDYGNEVVR